MLAQIAIAARIDLSASIIKVMVFDKRAELRRPIVVCSCDNLPGEVRMIFPSAGAEVSVRAAEIESCGFGIINANASAGVRLKFSEGESPNKISHECSGINKGSRAGLSEYVSVCQPHRGISTTPEAVVKEVPFNGRAKYTCAKDVTELNAAEKADVILRANRESVTKPICENSVTAPILIHVGAHIDCSVKTYPVKFGWWRRGDILVGADAGFAGLQRNSKSTDDRCDKT